MSDNFLKEIGRSYIVSAFLPAAFFVSIGYFLFYGFLPLGVVDQVIASGEISKYQWLVMSILVLWTAFYLYSANDVTVRLFEGYFIPEAFYRSVEDTNAQKRWEEINLPEYDRWKKGYEQLREADTISGDEDQSHFLSVLRALAEIANVNLKQPLELTQQMPTRLGNVLRSSETYALERYFIIDTAIWPRLIPVLPTQVTKHLEEKNNLFMFLLNSAFLSYGVSGFSLLFGFFGFFMPTMNLPQDFFYIGYKFVSNYSYLGIALLFAGFGYLLYRVAVNAAEDFSMFIRTSFDLYRVNLLRQLNWEPPESLEEEKGLWLEVSKLLIAGNRIKADFSAFARRIQPEAFEDEENPKE